MSHTERDAHDEHDCWVPIFVAWADGETETLNFGGRAVPERLQRLLTALEPTNHVLALDETGWTLQHPLACRPNLSSCWLNAVAPRLVNQLTAMHGQEGALHRWEVITNGEDVTDVRPYEGV